MMTVMGTHFGFTDAIILGSIVILLAVDGILDLRGDPTISDRSALWAMRYPIIAVLAGVLIGHLFWPNMAYCP